MAGLVARQFCDTQLQRGDANADELIDIADATLVVGYVFWRADSPTCLDAADGNDAGSVRIADPVYLLHSLFREGCVAPDSFVTC